MVGAAVVGGGALEIQFACTVLAAAGNRGQRGWGESSECFFKQYETLLSHGGKHVGKFICWVKRLCGEQSIQAAIANTRTGRLMSSRAHGVWRLEDPRSGQIQCPVRIHFLAQGWHLLAVSSRGGRARQLSGSPL